MPKLLGQFLNEPQEPFALEAYLLERSYLKGTTRNARSALCKSAKFLKRRNVVPNCSNFLKDVFSQFLMVTNNQKLKNSENNRSSKIMVNEADIRRFAARCGNFSLEKEVDADKELEWTVVEDNKQLSPISVLEDTESDEVSPLHYTQGESSTSTSTSQCKIKQPRQHHRTFQEVQELTPYSQYSINKRTLLQKKQLLIDCVREVIEKHRKRDKRREILGADELRKLFCENIWKWSQESINETNIINIVHHHLMDSAEEWSADYEQEKMQISMEVGSAILEDVINEIVTCKMLTQ